MYTKYALVLVIICLSIPCCAEQTFLGKVFDDRGWEAVQRKLRCLSTGGQWSKANAEAALLPDGSIDMDRYAPCHTGYNHDLMCVHNMRPPHPPSISYYWDNTHCTIEIPTKRPRSITTSASTKIGSRKQGLCEMMRKARGNIAFVGDSISEEFYVSFLNLLMVDGGLRHRRWCPWSYSVLCSEGGRKGDEASWEFSVHFFRNDRLSVDLNETRTRAGGGEGGRNTLNSEEHPWIGAMVDKNISLLVLNRGAHFVVDKVLLEELKITLSQLRKLQHQSQQRQNGNEISIIWRNTPHGHLDYKRRFDSPPLSTRPHITDERYNYSSFERQNSMVQYYLAEHHPSILYMDVFEMTVLRADSHRDPLHYCIPGPIDSWAILLYDYLLVIYNSP